MSDTIFLIARHGETKLNKKHLHVGRSDAHLDEDGEKQAHEAGSFLAHTPFNIKHVISSPRTRALETAAIICAHLGIENFSIDPRLTDLNVGDLTDKSEFEYPIDEYVADPTKKFPNGESIDDYNTRQFEFANYLLDEIIAGRLKTEEVLIVTHAPIIDFWYNLKHPDSRIGAICEIVCPGGIVSVTDEDVFPLLGKAKTTEEKQDAKTDPARLLYMPPESLGKDGAACGTCLLGVTEGKNAGKCTSVHADSDESDTHVSLEHGVCGLYVKGKADPLVQIQPIVSRTQAGYINRGAPTRCAACSYFMGDKEFGCHKVDGRKTAKGYIEAGGCCNGWESKNE